MKECVICKTCKKDFDEKHLNCAPCRKKLALKAKQYRLKHGAEINARRLGKRSKQSGNYKYRCRIKPMSEYPPKTCLHCDKIFQPSKHQWQVAKYCSDKCRSRQRIEENKKLRWSKRREITCRECGITAKPIKSDGTTCGGRRCVDNSRRKTKLKNGIKANAKGGHRYKKVRAYMRKYHKQRRKIDPAFRLHTRISAGVRHSLRNKNGLKTFDLLNYTFDELYSHLESQFTDDMSWDNMNEWEIDHIRPVSSFNFDSTDHPDFKKCWALNNLQTLWAKDNRIKWAHWDGVVNA